MCKVNVIANSPRQIEKLICGHPYAVHTLEKSSTHTRYQYRFFQGAVFGVRRVRFNDHGVIMREIVLFRVSDNPAAELVSAPWISRPVELLIHAHGRKNERLAATYLKALAELGIDPARVPRLHRFVAASIEFGIALTSMQLSQAIVDLDITVGN